MTLSAGMRLGPYEIPAPIWEFGGQYLSTDQPSGRIIEFPNSNVLTTPVYLARRNEAPDRVAFPKSNLR